jgi:thiol-disulfide isomerase/thioredoxin
MNMPSLRCLPVFPGLLALGILGCSAGGSVEEGPRDGLWRAVLQVPGGELPFGLEFATEEGRRHAVLINGDDRVRIDEIKIEGARITLRMPGYENRIEASFDAESLDGTLTMIKSGGKPQIIPLTAKHGQSWRFVSPTETPSVTAADLTGRWALQFVDGEKTYPAVAELKQSDAIVTGTVLTPTGDHRFIAGELRGNELRLSKFDGGHVFLYHATIKEDGSLDGRFWSGTAHTETFSGKRDDSASLGDAANKTALVGDAEKLDFTFPDLGGSSISLNNSFFRGKVIVVALAGSWCPNCHDEAAFLAELHRRKRPQGFEVVSLMFEQFGDFPKAAEAVYRFRDRYKIEYTTLIAGISDKDDAASKLPQLNGVFAFPTTIFVDRSGKVRKIHTGFSGPATGVHYEKLVDEFEKTVDSLLAEPTPPAA